MMRLVTTGKRNEYNVWLTGDELDQLCRAATTVHSNHICQLSEHVSLRVFEISQICPSYVSRINDDTHYHLRASSEKDTTGNSSSPHVAYLPACVERDLHHYQTSENIAPDDPLVDLSERWVRAIVKECVHRAADMTVEDWDSFQMIESYLNTPSPEVVNDGRLA
jgi:hypothetical protein